MSSVTSWRKDEGHPLHDGLGRQLPVDADFDDLVAWHPALLILIRKFVRTRHRWERKTKDTPSFHERARSHRGAGGLNAPMTVRADIFPCYHNAQRVRTWLRWSQRGPALWRRERASRTGSRMRCGESSGRPIDHDFRIARLLPLLFRICPHPPPASEQCARLSPESRLLSRRLAAYVK